MLEIDASAGGQVMRSALALSALLDRPLKLSNIRARRPNPGLQAQHLASVNALASICSAKLENAKLGSKELLFTPSEAKDISFAVNIHTAGSTMLVLQTILPASMLANVKLRLHGGTDAAFAPPFNHFNEVLLPVLRSIGVKAELQLISHGYFPRGNGIVSFKSSKAKLPLKPIILNEKPELSHIKIFSHCISLPRTVAIEQANSSEKVLSQLGVEIVQELYCSENENARGSGIDCIAYFKNGFSIGANSLGAKGIPAEKVGSNAARLLLTELESNAAVDLHLADQLLIFMALAKGKSGIICPRITDHIANNISVIEKILGVKFEKNELENKSTSIWVEGTAFKK